MGKVFSSTSQVILDQHKSLFSVIQDLQSYPSFEEKAHFLSCCRSIKKMDLFTRIPRFASLSVKQQYLLYAFALLKQSHIVSILFKNPLFLDPFLKTLETIESFYTDSGGILGYQYLALSLINKKSRLIDKEEYIPPHTVDQTDDLLRNDFLLGLKGLSEIAYICPLGGAGDRLHLHGNREKGRLPVALFPFAGKTLLQRLLEEIEGYESLYGAIFHKRIRIPIIFMISAVHGSDHQLYEFLDKHHWFHRGKESFQILLQPLVPVVSEEGQWVIDREGALMTRPGGHGAIWQLMKQYGSFDWLQRRGISRALVRQINNPIGGNNHAILSFLGGSIRVQSLFSAIVCDRIASKQEGRYVVSHTAQGYALKNLEYCISDKDHQIKDYSILPANTNILALDVKTAGHLVSACTDWDPFINFRTAETMGFKSCTEKHDRFGRIETTIQCLFEKFRAPTVEMLRTHLLRYPRREIFAPIKYQRKDVHQKDDTVDAALSDYFFNQHDLLVNYCGWKIETKTISEQGAHHTPSFLFLYHPKLGPLYTMIREKISGGSLAHGGIVFLNIQDCYLRNVHVKGTLFVDMPPEEKGDISNLSQGSLYFEEVTIENDGQNISNSSFSIAPFSIPSCQIVFHGVGQCIAKNIILRGNIRIDVFENERIFLLQDVEGNLEIRRERIQSLEKIWDVTIAHQEVRLVKNINF